MSALIKGFTGSNNELLRADSAGAGSAPTQRRSSVLLSFIRAVLCLVIILISLSVTAEGVLRVTISQTKMEPPPIPNPLEIMNSRRLDSPWMCNGITTTKNISDEIPLVRCSNAVTAYAAAYLTTSKMFLDTPFPDHAKGQLEAGSGFYMFQSGRQALKTKCPTDFYVDHLSGFEYHATLAHPDSGLRGKASIADRGAIAASQCDILEAETDVANANPLPCSVALIPFWMGYGNGGHSAAPPEVRLNHFRGTVCSVAQHFEKVVVGACRDFRRNYYQNSTDVEILQSLDMPIFDVVELDCEKGPNLITRLLRHAQEKLRTHEWPASFVYYTEMDQVLFVPAGIQVITDQMTAHQDVYLSPNRLEELFDGHVGANRGPLVRHDGRRFAQCNQCG